METIDGNSVEIFANVDQIRDKAVRIKDGAAGYVWLPLSEIRMGDIDKYGYAAIRMPEWLAKAKGLI